MKICAVYKVLDYKPWLEISLKSIINQVDKVFIWQNEYSWNGKHKANELLDMFSFKFLNENRELGSKVSVKINREVLDWRTQMQLILDLFLKEYKDYWYLYIDSDEVYEDGAIKKIIDFKERHYNNDNFAFMINIYTYWKKIFYRIKPLEPYTPTILFKPTKDTFFIDIRKVEYNPVLLFPGIPMMHHFSYVLNDQQVLKKIGSLKDSGQIYHSWYNDKWIYWKPGDKHLHPVIPSCFNKTEKVKLENLPKVIRDNLDLIPEGLR